MCIHTRNINHDWGGLCKGTKDAKYGVFSTFELNFCKAGSRSKLTKIAMSGLLQISLPSLCVCNTVNYLSHIL